MSLPWCFTHEKTIKKLKQLASHLRIGIKPHGIFRGDSKERVFELLRGGQLIKQNPFTHPEGRNNNIAGLGKLQQ